MPKLYISNKAKIALVYRPNTTSAIEASIKLAQWLKKKNFKPMTAPSQKMIPGTTLMKSDTDFNAVELLIVLGGDGTYLRGIRLLEGRPIPILGVNLGSLGFLTPLKLNNLYQYLPSLLQGGKGELLPRTQMLVTLTQSIKNKKTWRALNDVVVERGPSSHLIDLKIGMDQNLVSSIKADGLVLSTPTGSTAYNLAAGGPIVHPESNCFIATSVAPHSLTSRPLIFPDNRDLHIQIQNQCESANLVIDGRLCARINQSTILKVSKHSEPHWMVQPFGYNFYDLMRDKLSFGERD